jgi:hypothetical protein
VHYLGEPFAEREPCFAGNEAKNYPGNLHAERHVCGRLAVEPMT